MALSDYYDFGPLMAQLQQGGQGMSGGMGTPMNSWNGGQFVMPQVAPPAPIPQLAPYAGTAMDQAAPAQPNGLLGPLGGKPRRAGRPGGMGNGNGNIEAFNQLRGLFGVPIG